MEAGHLPAGARTDPGRGAHVGVARLRGMLPAIAGYGGPFLLIAYLALEGGGYDPIVRGEIGVAIWWLAFLGLAVGALPITRVTRAGWIALALLAGLALWTALGTAWSESSERSITELARVTSYCGVLALALMTQGRDGLRRFACGAGAAIGFVAALALLSRLHPQWFTDAQGSGLLRATEYRLSYPVGYWNGLAALVAMGVPLMLWIATSARTVAVRAVAHAAVPAMALAVFYTFSRGGAAEVLIGCAALIALHPRRLSLMPALAVTVAGSAILIVAATQRDALADGTTSAAALDQAGSMLAMTLVVCAGVGLIGAALALAARAGIGPRLAVSRRASLIALAVTVVVAAGAAVAVDLPGEASNAWQEFKQAAGPGEAEQRFESASGNGRYRYWEAALDANATAPLTGIGAGTFEFWWSQNGTAGGFVRDAHSLYLETAAELGLIGLALLLGLLAVIGVTGAARALRSGSEDRRAALAAATAAIIAFAAAAAIDWTWELAVLPITAMLLAAAILGPSAESRHRRHSRFERQPPSMGVRIAASAAAGVALLVVMVPLAGSSALRSSQVDAAAGRIGDALGAARTADAFQPYAATPQLQEAMLLEQTGDLEPALVAARLATDAEATNWRTWLVLSRIEARAGHPEKSVAAFERARELNPRSPLLR